MHSAGMHFSEKHLSRLIASYSSFHMGIQSKLKMGGIPSVFITPLSLHVFHFSFPLPPLLAHVIISILDGLDCLGQSDQTDT